MSLLLRAAAAAARRMPSATTTPAAAMHGRRAMASSSSAAGTETMEGAWLVRLGLCWGAVALLEPDLEKKIHHITGQARAEEIETLQQAMEEFWAWLNKRR